MLTVRSTINIAGQTVPQIIPVVQGDTGRAIQFTIADFTIPTGSTARYYIQKPSGNAVYNNATIEDNNVVVNLTAQAIAETGDNYGQVRIENDGEIVTSFDFILLVKAFRGIGAVESETEMNIFDQAVEQAEAEITEAKEEALAEIAETGSGNIAVPFDAADSYLAGEYVIYNAKFYKFTSAHTGPWTGSDAEELTVGDALTDLEDETNQLKEEISQLSGLSEEVKVALLQIAQKVAYVDEHGQDYYDDLYDALYPPADLVSISAVYTQTKTIYNTDDLDKLKSDLVVTAHMSDSTTQTVTEYTLSGTLTEGTSTVTVSYGGKTTTFTVTVTAGLYPMTITASDSGVGFGSVDAIKPTMTPPYVSNANKTRAYAFGENALGYEVNPAKQYRISITATEDVNVNMIIHEFNETAYEALQNVQAVSSDNKTASSWLSITPSTPYTYTPTQLINGEPPVCIWLVFKQADGGGWANLGNSVFPITIEQL